jgi:hypothetical protein
MNGRAGFEKKKTKTPEFFRKHCGSRSVEKNVYYGFSSRGQRRPKCEAGAVRPYGNVPPRSYVNDFVVRF